MEHAQVLWRRRSTEIATAITGLLALACYGFVLQLPFFRDDLPIMSWLSDHSWADIWTRSSENQFYRPLAFTIYKLGRLLPSGVDRTVLHGVSLLMHWVSAGLVMRLVRLRRRSDGEALLASVLFVVFPFTFTAIPWITAMSHPLVTMLTLLAAFAALKAEGEDAVPWRAVSLLAIAIAPAAHESGYVCAIIVAGVVAIEHGLTGGRRPWLLGLGVLLNLAAAVWRSQVPGAGKMSLAGLKDWVGNTMFSLHGLVYPTGSVIGTLVRRLGVSDFLLVGTATMVLSLALVGLAISRRGLRWAASGLWWWGCGMLPAVVSLRYGYNYASPRVYALAAPGIVMMWAGLTVTLSKLTSRTWARLAVTLLIGGAIVVQNVAFLRRQRALFTTLGNVYQRVLEAAATQGDPAPGFVNLPVSLAYPERTYALALETVLFIPSYSSLSEFLGVNGVRLADAVLYSPVIEESEYVVGLRGEGLGWQEMRQFAADHGAVWLARWRDGDLVLDHVGSIEAGSGRFVDQSLATFEGGIAIESAFAEKEPGGSWRLAIEWIAQGPVDGQIFVHVHDAQGDLITQADGPALGGMVPPWTWLPGDRIHDMRYVSLPGPSSHTVLVGLFDADGRIPASQQGVRCPQDACLVATLQP